MKGMQLFQAWSGSEQKLASSYHYSNSGCMGNKNSERKEESGRAHWRQKSRGSAVHPNSTWSALGLLEACQSLLRRWLQGGVCKVLTSQRPRVTFITFGFYVTSPNYFLTCAPISPRQVWVLFHTWTSVSDNIWPSHTQRVLFQAEYSSPVCIEHGFLGSPSTMGVKQQMLSPFQRMVEHLQLTDTHLPLNFKSFWQSLQNLLKCKRYINSHYSILFKKQLKEKMFIQVRFRHQFPHIFLVSGWPNS